MEKKSWSVLEDNRHELETKPVEETPVLELLGEAKCWKLCEAPQGTEKLEFPH